VTQFYFQEALMPDGWAKDITVDVDPDGIISGITADTTQPSDATRIEFGLPGMANVHSHAFQRGMAGLSEIRGPGEDSFWSWRKIMYAFNDSLTPEHVEAMAALVYCEMLETGFTSVGEFHYLHHASDGTPYSDLAEMAGRVCAAAETSGIALTLLPVLYRHSNFGDKPPVHGQRRFINGIDQFADLVSASQTHLGRLDHGVMGISPHSLRAASSADIAALLELCPDGPVHIHAAEQVKEVDDCIAATGRRPVEYLFDTQTIDQRWCLIHSTHLDASEVELLARSGAVAGLCPLTEGNLGDGFFQAPSYLDQGGQFGIGSDSHIRIDLAEDLRLLEYGHRLLERKRNVLARPGGSTGRRLFETALRGGARALQQPAGRIEVGQRADFVALDTNDPTLVGRAGDQCLDSWLFCGDSRLVKQVWVGGRKVVDEGKALCRETVNSRYADAMTDIMRAVNA
jgi:formimidoylglutamate deiminase